MLTQNAILKIMETRRITRVANMIDAQSRVGHLAQKSPWEMLLHTCHRVRVVFKVILVINDVSVGTIGKGQTKNEIANNMGFSTTTKDNVDLTAIFTPTMKYITRGQRGMYITTVPE